MRIKVLICCRVYLFAEGVKKLLEIDENVQVSGVLSDIRDMFDNLMSDYDILILDLYTWNALGRESVNVVDKKILLIVDSHELTFNHGNLQKMVSDGLSGIITNTSDSKILLKALNRIYYGDLWIDHNTIKKSLNCNNNYRNINLTKMEHEILNCLCSGHTNKETARKLCISEQTVKSHCNHLFKKFGVSNRLKLVLSAKETVNFLF